MCDEEDDITLVDKMVDNVNDDTCVINGYPNAKETVVNRVKFMASIVAERFLKRLLLALHLSISLLPLRKNDCKVLYNRKQENQLLLLKRLP